MVSALLCVNARREGIATLKLAKLYRVRGNNSKAAGWYKEHVAQYAAVDPVRALACVTAIEAFPLSA